MKRLILAATSLTLLFGCAIPEEDFSETYGKNVCKRLKECDQGSYENSYADKQDCIDDWTDVGDLILDAGDLFNQDYNEDKARDCISSMKDASCGDFSDGSFECDLFD